MSTELLELSRRVERLEFVVGQLSEAVVGKFPQEPYSSLSAKRGALLLAGARSNAHKANEYADRLFKHWGITEKPVGRKNLQKLYAADAFNESDNQFARGIIDMREE